MRILSIQSSQVSDGFDSAESFAPSMTGMSTVSDEENVSEVAQVVRPVREMGDGEMNENIDSQEVIEVARAYLCTKSVVGEDRTSPPEQVYLDVLRNSTRADLLFFRAMGVAQSIGADLAPEEDVDEIANLLDERMRLAASVRAGQLHENCDGKVYRYSRPEETPDALTGPAPGSKVKE